MAWKPTTTPRATHTDCERCGEPVLHQRHGLPYTVTTGAEKLTLADASARTDPNRLAWCLRETRAGARLVEVLSPFHNPQCPRPHLVDHRCPAGTPTVKGALW